MTDDARYVFVIDDDHSVRRALTRLLASAGYRAETFDSAEEFLGSRRLGLPGCLVVDVQMPGLNGLELQERLAAEMAELPIVFLTGHGDIPMSVHAMKVGAVDFLTKPVEDEQLLAAIARATAVGDEARGRLAEVRSIRERAALLTPRERQVMELVVTGMLNKQITYDLGTSEKTIKVHRARVMEKMKASSVAELVRLVDRLHVAEPS